MVEITALQAHVGAVELLRRRDLFDHVIDYLKQTAIQGIEASNPDDAADREVLYNEIRSLNNIRAVVERLADTKPSKD